MDVLKSQHDAKRTFATSLFYAGVNPKDIQALMRHENIEQTMAYIKRKEKSGGVNPKHEKSGNAVFINISAT